MAGGHVKYFTNIGGNLLKCNRLISPAGKSAYCCYFLPWSDWKYSLTSPWK